MHFKQLSLEQGASSVWIFDVAEDSLGYMWFGGHTGLDRFDGNKFKSYKHDPDDESTLAENQIYRIHVTPDNHLLLSTLGGGLNHYNSITGQITRFPIEQVLSGFGSHKGDIIRQQDGTYLAMASRPARILHFEESGQLCQTIPIVYQENGRSTAESHTSSLLKMGNRTDEFFVFSKDRCFTLNINSGLLIELSTLSEKISKHIGTQTKFQTGIFINDQQLLLSLETGQVLLINLPSYQITTLKKLLPTEYIVRISKAQDGGYWLINNTARLFYYDPLSNEIQENKLNLKGLEKVNFISICQSKDSTIWIGTFNHGVLYHTPSENIFSFAPLSDQFKDIKVNDRFISSVIDPLKTLVYTSFDFEKDILKTDLLTGQQTRITLPGSILKTLYKLRYWNDSTLVFHDRQNLYELSLNTHKFQPFSNQIISRYFKDKNKRIVDVFTDSDKRILVETREEWVISFPDLDELIILDRTELGEPEVKTSTIMHYPSGTYILTEKNIYFVPIGSKNAEKLYFNIPQKRASTYAFRTLNIFKDTLYIGCVLKGVYKFIKTGKNLELYDHWHTSNHLLSNNIQYSQIRQDSILWLSTGLGLQLINLNQNRFLEVSHTQNIPFLLFDRLLTFNKDGYFATNTDHYIIWAKEDQLLRIKPAKLILSSLQVHDNEIVPGSKWPENETVILNYDENFFQLSLSLLRHIGTLSQVRIKLEGFDQGWKILDKQLSQAYTNVPPGEYTLKAEVINQIQQQPLDTLVIPITIKAPFWQTWWFRLLGGIFIISIFFIIYRLKINTVRREEAIKTEYNKQLADLEMQNLRSQMNPHFMFNSLNSIKHYILKNEREKASDYLSNFASLIRSILNFSHTKFISLAEELNTLNIYIELEQLRFSKGFDYKITIDRSIDASKVLVQPLIFQPYIENAIWHGLMHKDQDRILNLTCKIVSQQLICTIEDNGIGRHKASQVRSKSATKKSYGLQITEARMKAQDANAEIIIEDLYNSDGLPTGTKVTLILPLKMIPKTTETT